MPIDTSSYGQQPAPPNLVGTLGAAATIQNQLNQNRLFGQQFQSNVALSQAAKQSVDANGNFDPAAYRAAVAGGPAGYMLPQAIEQSQQIQQGQNTISQQQIDLAKNHLSGVITNYLTPLLQNPNVNSKDVATALGQAHTTGIADIPTITSIWSTVPRDPQGNIIETQVPTWIKQQMVRALDAQQQLNAMSPPPTLVQNNQGQIPMRLPQIGQPSVSGPAIPNMPAPTQQTYNPVTKRMEFVGNLPNAGVAPPSVPGGPDLAPTPSPSPASPPGQGANPLANAMPGIGSGGQASPAPAVGLAPGTPAAPALGEAEAATEQASASAKQGVALQQTADQVPQMKATLGNLEGLLNSFTPGPGSKWTNESGAFFNRAIQALGGKGAATDAISAQEEFNKQAIQLAQSQFSALGGTGTDAKLDSAMHTSPNAALSKLGNQNIINLLKGNADAIAVKNREWQQYQQEHGPQSYGQFSTAFNAAFDPRTFQAQYMTPQDRSKMLSGMSKPEQAQFRQSYNFAVQNGWIPDPRQAQASANGGQ